MKRLPALRRSSLALLALSLGALCLRADAPKDWSALPARSTPQWVRDAVIYEVFPRQFSATGDFAGITARLDELKALGVDVVWLMPIHPIGKLKAKGTIGSPYAVRDYYAVNPDYGTKADFRALVEGAHARGMKVIIDIVANHTAWDSVMMSKPSFYKRDADGKVIPPHPDWLDVAGLNYENPETREYMREMLRYWVTEFKLDGYRCDVAGEVPTSFWEEVRDDLSKINPEILMLAEANKPELMVKAFDVDYAWPLMGTLNKVMMEGAPATELKRCWNQDERALYPKGALHMRISDNHDEARAVSRFGWKGSLAASAIMFTLDGVPLIYNGMEVGDSSESGDPALFEKLPIFWKPKQRESFRETYRQFIALRKAHSALRNGTTEWVGNSAENNVVSFVRRDSDEEIVTVVNISNRPQTVSLNVGQGQAFTMVLGAKPASGEAKGGLWELPLGAYEWRIYHRSLKP